MKNTPIFHPPLQKKKDKRLLQINQDSWVALSLRYRNLVWISIINRFSKVDLNEFLLVHVEKNTNTTGRSGGHCVKHISTLVVLEVFQLHCMLFHRIQYAVGSIIYSLFLEGMFNMN